MIRAHSFVSEGTFAHQIRKRLHMARCLPDGRIHEDAGVETHDVLAVPHHGPPPDIAQIPLQFRTQRTVIPHSAAAAVYFGRLEDESPAFAETDDLLHEWSFPCGL